MRDSFVALFTTLTTLFNALNLFAKSVESVAKIADQAADGMYQEETIKHQAKLVRLKAQLAASVEEADTKV